jgi:hypothetical protein
VSLPWRILIRLWESFSLLWILVLSIMSIKCILGASSIGPIKSALIRHLNGSHLVFGLMEATELRLAFFRQFSSWLLILRIRLSFQLFFLFLNKLISSLKFILVRKDLLSSCCQSRVRIVYIAVVLHRHFTSHCHLLLPRKVLRWLVNRWSFWLRMRNRAMYLGRISSLRISLLQHLRQKIPIRSSRNCILILFITCEYPNEIIILRI